MMRQFAELKGMVEPWDGLAQRVQDGLDLLGLAEAEDDLETAQAIAVDAEDIAAELRSVSLHWPSVARTTGAALSCHSRGRRRH